MFTTKLIEDVLGELSEKLRDLSIDHCSIDSRKVTSSGIFFAFDGERVDGHDFIEKLTKDNVICIGSKDLGFNSDYYIKVADVQEIITELARQRRAQISSKVIALTGSSGKTSTRQLIVAMLELLGKSVYATKGNYNNHLGLPLTILNSPDDVDFIVLELGMNHSGEIADLTKTAAPDISVINNIGTAHIGNFRSQSELAAAKLELFDNTKGTKVADMDDPFINEWVKENGADDVLTYNSKNAQSFYDLFPEQPKYMIDNLFCAENVIKSALGQKVDRNNVFNKLSLPKMRGEVKVVGEREFVVDCYNANPESMRRSIDEFFEKYGKDDGKDIYLILGSMFELGEFSKKLHRELVNYIKRANLLKRAFLVGCEFEKVKSDFLNEKRVVFAGDVQDLFDVVPDAGSFLLKGSRGNRLERIIERLEKEK